MSEPTLKRVIQLGIVVKDAQKAAEVFCELFDIDPANVNYIDTAEGNSSMCFRGEKIRLKHKLAVLQHAGMEFEFIQPGESHPSPQKEFLEAHGPGLHHICVVADNYKQITDKMEQMGAAVMIEGGTGEIAYKYMDMQEQTGLIFEVYNEALLKMKNN